MRSYLQTVFFAMVAWAVFAPRAQAIRGVVTTQVGPVKDNAYSVVVQEDGKLVAAGASHNGNNTDIAILRYLPSGAPDAEFGDGGVALFDSGLGDDQAYQVALQSDGKIVAVGSAHNGQNLDLIILRFMPSGALDAGFGTNGVVKVSFGIGKDVGYTLAIQKDGKILAAGTAFNGSNQDFAVARVMPDGKMDRSFGTLGKAIAGFNDSDGQPGEEHGYSVVVQPDGRILLSGYSETAESSVMTTVRFMPNGRVDRTFGAEGVVATQVGQKQDRAYDSVLQADGKLLVAGSSQTANQTHFAMVRYLPNGKLDPTFGEGGMVRTPVGASMDIIYGIALQADGRILAGGSYFNGRDADLAVVRYLPSGQVDVSFGNSGAGTLALAQQYDAIYGIAIQPDQKVVVAGVTGESSEYRVAIARFSPQGMLDASFGSDSKEPQRLAGRPRKVITAEVGLPGWVFPFFPGGP